MQAGSCMYRTGQDTHCRKTREMMAVDALRRMADQKEEDGWETPVC